MLPPELKRRSVFMCPSIFFATQPVTFIVSRYQYADSRNFFHCVLSAPSLDLGHALPAYLSQRHARSPKGHQRNTPTNPLRLTAQRLIDGAKLFLAVKPWWNANFPLERFAECSARLVTDLSRNLIEIIFPLTQ
jgi:hypothetical protein